jgi:hypothetical protein
LKKEIDALARNLKMRIRIMDYAETSKVNINSFGGRRYVI